jgi:hypothetical protein
MYPFELNSGVERYNEMLREAEEYRRAAACNASPVSWYSRVAKLFARPQQTTAAATVSHRPVTSAR